MAGSVRGDDWCSNRHRLGRVGLRLHVARGTRGGTVRMDQPAPVYQVGQHVRVVLGERNRSARRGTIRAIIWHYKDRRFHYYIEEDGKRVSKRYQAEDLEAYEP